MTRYYIFLPLIPGLMLSSTAPARGQEQGRPRGLPPSAEFAEQFFRDGRGAVVGMSAAVCPDESEWHRNVLTRLLDPDRRTVSLITHGAYSFRALLARCEWPPAHAWFRDVVMDPLMATLPWPEVRSLISGILDTWTPGDREVVLRFALRDDLESIAKTDALNRVSARLTRPEKVDWFFEVYEAGALTEGYASNVLGFIDTGEFADVFVRRGAQSVAEHPELPLAPLVLERVALVVVLRPGVSRTAATAALGTLDRVAGRGEFSKAIGYRAAVARAAGGGGEET